MSLTVLAINNFTSIFFSPPNCNSLTIIIHWRRSASPEKNDNFTMFSDWFSSPLKLLQRRYKTRPFCVGHHIYIVRLNIWSFFSFSALIAQYYFLFRWLCSRSFFIVWEGRETRSSRRATRHRFANDIIYSHTHII